MNYLMQGQESRGKIELLLALTKISSEKMTDAIQDYFVRGFGVGDAANLCGVKQPNLSVAIEKLNKVAEIVEKVNELKYTS